MKHAGKRRARRLFTVPAAALCALLLVLPVQASGDGFYASDETGAEVPGAAQELITVDPEPVALPPEPEQPLTPDGNLSLKDDLSQALVPEETPPVREFLTVQTRSGHYFYLIVDRTDSGENVHFLNQVDASDLLRILEEEPEEEAVCICQIRCETGDVNTACPVCRLHKDDCLGSVRRTEPEPEPVPLPEPEPEPEETPSRSGRVRTALLIVLLLGLGGAAVWFFLFRRGKEDVRGRFDLEPYARQMEEEFSLEDSGSEADPGLPADPEPGEREEQIR